MLLSQLMGIFTLMLLRQVLLLLAGSNIAHGLETRLFSYAEPVSIIQPIQAERFEKATKFYVLGVLPCQPKSEANERPSLNW